MTEKLLLCPFCHNNDYVNNIENTYSNDLMKEILEDYIICMKCCFMAPYIAWNTRASPMQEWCPYATQELIKCQKAFNDLHNKTKWIKSSDRMPEKDGRYLVVEDHHGHWVCVSSMRQGKFDVQPLYWQELPALPKETTE